MPSFLKSWFQFWFDPIDARLLGLFRTIFASILLIMYSIRFLEFDLLFGKSGLMPFEKASLFPPETHLPLFFWFPHSETALFYCYLVFLGLLLALALGLVGRRLCWLVFALHLMFIQRNMSIMYGADLVSNFFLFYLCFTNSHHYFSIRNIFFSDWEKPIVNWIDSMAFRLIQLQLCVIYGFTGLEKLKGPSWWEGTSVWTVLMNSQQAPFDFSFFAYVPSVVVVMTWMTVLFEIYFPAVIWLKGFRPYWLLIGVAFHMGAAVFMSLPFFSTLMLSSYILFIDPKWFEKDVFRKFFLRLGFRHRQHL